MTKDTTGDSHSKFRFEQDNQSLPAADSFRGRPIVPVEWQGRQVETVTGLFSVKVRDETGFAEWLLGEALGIGGKVYQTIDRLGIQILELDPGWAFDWMSRSVDSVLSPFHWIEPVMVDRISEAVKDPELPRQSRQFELINADDLDLTSAPHEGVVLAILDTGIPMVHGALSHEDLDDPLRFFTGDGAPPVDQNGHGTHVTGIAAATSNNGVGIAGLWPGAVFVVKAFDAAGVGTDHTFKEGVLAAIDFANGRGARLVINYSGGGPPSKVKEEAIQAASAYQKGALIVAAAGGPDVAIDSGAGGAASGVEWPAAYSVRFNNVAAVAALDAVGGHYSFSPRGPELTVSAPGNGVYSTLPGYSVASNDGSLKYGERDGTSMACAFVSGLAALVWAKHPEFSSDRVRHHIVSTAQPKARPAEFGSGIIDVRKALA